MTDLTLDVLRDAVAGTAAAFRCITEYEPAGGPGDKVFPPTYEGGKYAEEERVDSLTGEVVKCVVLDSVQSQANRMELALLDAMEEPDGLRLPLLKVEFKHPDLSKRIVVTSLEAPHRIADAIFRDSLVTEEGKKVRFRESSKGRVLDASDIRNATELFRLCPTGLLFGLWDSTGPRGGLGAKFQRAIVSEIVGYGVVQGCRSSSRIDPLQIPRDAGPIFRAADGKNWTLDPELALLEQGKPVLWGKAEKGGGHVLYDAGKNQDAGKPSKINHGNVTPSLTNEKTKEPLPGGFTIRFAKQRTVISLPALRRLRFPIADANAEKQAAANLAARTALAALGIAAATLAREQGADLRSRCQLVPTSPFEWECVDLAADSVKFKIDATVARQLLTAAITAATQAGLPWDHEVVVLEPSLELLELVRRSQQLDAADDGED
jgi:CRISPR-associated protein Csb1